MSRFTFWRKFGGKHVSAARPAIANGINLSAVKSFHSKDDMWDRGLSRNIRVNSSTGTTYDGVTLTGRNQVVVDPNPSTNPSGDRINASSNGLNVSNILGISYGSIKMDYDGRIYPTNNLGINELIIRFAQWIEPGTVPNMRFLIDFQNPTAQIKAGSMIGFALDATAPGGGNLGNGKYVVILASEGVNVSRSLVIALSTVDSTGFLFRCTPCDINGNDPTGYTASGRISTPAFAARVNNAAMMVRCLDLDTINNDDVRGGDTLTHGTRTQEAWTESTLTKSQLIKLCNECSVGYHIQFAVYDDPTYIASVLANYVSINSPLVTVEYSNEPWNTGTFIHGAQTALEGSRLSFDIPLAVISGGATNYATYTPAQVAGFTIPRPIRSYNLGNETTTSCDVASGEEYFTNVSGIGTLVVKARVARPLGSACVNKYSSSHAYTPGEVVIISSGAAYFFTATQSFTGTAPPVAWVSATTYNDGNIALGSDGNIYVVATGHGPTTGVNPVGDLTGTWVAATAVNSPWMIATVANPNGANWTLTSNFTQTQIAGARYRMTKLKSFKAIADPLFAAAGKPRPKYMLNIQLNGSQTVGPSSLLQHVRWDGGWDVMDDEKMAPYMGGDLALGNDLFWRTFPNALGGGTIGTLTPQLKMNLYDTTVVGDPGASGGIVDITVANFVAQCDIIWDAQATNIAQQKVLLQAAALADGCSTWASKRIGTYENNQFGLITDLPVPSTKDRGPWPDDTAVAWSAAKTYNPSDGSTDTTTTFAYVGTELYRCLVTNTNVSPTSDPTKWGHVTKCSNGNPRWLEWYFRLMRDPAIGTMLRNFDIAVQARVGDGDWMRYQQYSALVGTVGSTIQFWGLQETGIDTANTRWQASVLTAADWRARA